MLSPIIDELSAEYEGKVNVCKCDVDEAEEIAMRYSIMSIPTIIVFKNGEAAKTFVGVTAKDAILDAVK